jgi:uncharacterized membrane protein
MSQAPAKPLGSFHPIRRAILRGLAVVLPPLLTVVVFLWAWNMIDTYILVPCERFAGQVIVWSIKDIKSGVPDGAVVYRSEPGKPVNAFEYKGTRYIPVDRGGKWIPDYVQATVDANPLENTPAPATAKAYFDHFVHVRYLRRERTVPLFLTVFVLALYLTGKLMAARVGRYGRRIGEGIVDRMPIVRDVYSAAKQITETVFSEHEMQFLRVVAVEYPRKGIWQIAFVTGEGFKDLYDVAGEPVVSLLVSHSPIPATGFTCTALKRDTIDLNITVDQAMQYIVSCGVVVPPHQRWNDGAQREIGDDISRHVLNSVDQTERLVKSA